MENIKELKEALNGCYDDTDIDLYINGNHIEDFEAEVFRNGKTAPTEICIYGDEEEKPKLKDLFTKCDIQVLDKEKTYLIKVNQEYVNSLPKEQVIDVLNRLVDLFKERELKYIITVGDMFDISEKEN